MAYDRHLADKITNIIETSTTNFYEKEMMGGITWMVDDKMCISIYKGGLMARVDPDQLEELMKRKGSSQMMHGSKPMQGYLTISPEGFDSDKDLDFWVQKCLEYNPKTKASKKK
jgi:hypothetical protein